MARNQGSTQPPITFVRYTPGFAAEDYVLYLETPFELNTPIQALQQEAGAKGCMVVVQAAIVPIPDLDPTQTEMETPNNE